MQNLKEYLSRNKVFKLICGAGNEDFEQIEKLITVYSEAGACMFDLSANIGSIQAYFNAQNRLGNPENRYFGISVGTDTDEHFRKAKINRDKCLSCGICRTVCLQNAVILKDNSYIIDEPKCIGCMECSKVCLASAIEPYIKNQEFERNIMSILNFCTPDFIELHCSSPDIEEINKKWNFLNDNFEGILSICINRNVFSDSELPDLLNNLLSCRKPFETIIQADGISMSGRSDELEKSLPSLMLARFMRDCSLPAYIFISGGVNSRSAELSKKLEIDVDGFALGTYARMIVKEHIEREDFFENDNLFNAAVETASELVNKLICR